MLAKTRFNSFNVRVHGNVIGRILKEVEQKIIKGNVVKDVTDRKRVIKGSADIKRT
jgi:hypothetical protein